MEWKTLVKDYFPGVREYFIRKLAENLSDEERSSYQETFLSRDVWELAYQPLRWDQEVDHTYALKGYRRVLFG